MAAYHSSRRAQGSTQKNTKKAAMAANGATFETSNTPWSCLEPQESPEIWELNEVKKDPLLELDSLNLFKSLSNFYQNY